MCLSNSRRVWTTSSAAADGVDARTSATKSAIVKSVFVADAGDHGNFRSEDSARDYFFVEGPQIFHGAAAAREDQHVDEFLSD